MEVDNNVNKDGTNKETVLVKCEAECDINETEISHEELMDLTSTTLNDILKEDTILRDLPIDVTLEEVTSQIAVLHGQSMTIYVHRSDGIEIPVVVHQKGTRVIDLKRSIQRHMTMYLKRQGINKKISWHYIWQAYYLYFDNTRLKDDKMLLSDIGIRNKSIVRFIRRLRDKGATASNMQNTVY